MRERAARPQELRCAIYTRKSSEEGRFLPRADQLGSRLDPRLEVGLVERPFARGPGDLAQLLFCCLRQPSERPHLHLIRNGADHEIATNVFRDGTAVELHPALAQLREAESRRLAISASTD